MAVQTTSNLSNSLRAQYIATYLEAAMRNRLYDQFAVPYTEFSGGLSMDDLMKSSSIVIPFISAMTPGTTAISETADVTPQTLVDATSSITWSSLGEALQWSEKLDIEHYTNYAEKRMGILGENQMVSVDLKAQAAALQGTFVYRAAARASLDAGTSGHRASDALFPRMQGYLQNLRVPSFITPDGGTQAWAALMHPYVFHDIRESGNVDSVGLYQDEGIHLNFELGRIGMFRLLVNAWAKVFYGAGIANSTDVDTTTSADAAALATTFDVTSNSNIAAGQWLNIGTIETGNTHYETNERVYVTGISSSTVSFLGEGPNGGFKYAHASGATVNHNDSVYPITFGGPASLIKVFATDIGEFGMVVGPKVQGLLDQFASIGWKWYGGYNRLVDNRILRVEVSTSYES